MRGDRPKSPRLHSGVVLWLGAGVFWLCVVLLAAPATSQTPTPGYEVVDELVGSITDNRGTPLSLDEAAAGAPQVTVDPAGDFEHVSGERPGFTRPHFDIVELVVVGTIVPGGEFATVFPSDAGPAWCSEGGPAPPSGVTIACPRGQTQTSFARGATIAGIVTDGPVPPEPQARCGYTIWGFDPGGPPPFAAPEGNADAGNGFNLGWAVFFEPGAGWIPFRFTDPGPTGYQNSLDDAPFVAIYEDQISFWIPSQQTASVTDINGWAFCLQEGTDASAQNSGSDQTGRVAFDMDPLPTFEFVFRVVTASPSPSPSPSGASVSPVPSPAAEAGSFRQTLLEIVIVIGGVTFLIGGYLYWKTRERPMDPLTGQIGDTRVREELPIAPPTVARTIGPQEPHAFCDWALYVETPKDRVPVRAAKGRECCVYRIRVGTELVSEERKAEGRQEPDATAAPGDRLQLPSLVSEDLSLNLSAEVTARSAPAGKPESMSGLGAPTATGEHRQTPAGEDPPEVAAHFQTEVNHTVRITLEAMCPGHMNTFSASGGTDVAAVASMGCTNSGPSECAVGITGSGSVDVKAEGFLDYHVEHRMGSDPEKAEDLLVPGVLFHVLTDLHDHRERDRGDYTGGWVDSDHATREGDSLELILHESLAIDAGVQVPRAAWPSTDQVTARAGTTIRNTLEIDGEMRRTECLDGAACCGLTDCRCEPRFKLRFDPIDAALFVEGELIGLFPPVKKLGSNEPWGLA